MRNARKPKSQGITFFLSFTLLHIPCSALCTPFILYLYHHYTTTTTTTTTTPRPVQMSKRAKVPKQTMSPLSHPPRRACPSMRNVHACNPSSLSRYFVLTPKLAHSLSLSLSLSHTPLHIPVPLPLPQHRRISLLSRSWKRLLPNRKALVRPLV